MKFRAFGIAILISGALAVPVPAEEQAQTQQVQQQATPADAPEFDDAFLPPGFPNPSPAPPGGEDTDMMTMGHDQMHHATGADVDAFEQMVNQVQAQVQAIGMFPSPPLPL